jgi:hypothetical protein
MRSGKVKYGCETLADRVKLQVDCDTLTKNECFFQNEQCNQMYSYNVSKVCFDYVSSLSFS